MSVLDSGCALLVAAALVLAGASADAQPPQELDAYALFAVSSLRADDLDVARGGIGVDRGPLAVRATLTAPSSVVAAESIQVGRGAQCGALFTALGVGGRPGCGPAATFSPPIISDVSGACGLETMPACNPGRPVRVPRHGTLSLPPGVYGDVVVPGPPTSALRLTAGEYVFCSLRLGRHAELQAEGAVDVTVDGDVSLGPGARAGVATGADPRGLSLGVGGATVLVSRGGALFGRLCAPDATLRFADRVHIEGSAVGGTIRAGRITVRGLPPASGTTTTTTTTRAPTTTTSSTTTTTPVTTTTSAPTTTTTSLPTTTTTTESTTSTTTAGTTTTSTTIVTTTSAAPTTTTSSTTSSTSTTTLPAVTCPASGLVDAVATLVPATDGSTRSPVAGFKVNLTYPASVVLPGSGVLPVDDPSDPATRVALLDLNLYSGLVIFNDTGTVLVTTAAPDSHNPVSFTGPYPFERARFDCTSGTPVSPGDFTCSVVDESDPLGSVIPPSQRPACQVTVTPFP